ncbi:MAG: ribbon-helix-helix protein, CopG family [Acidimicrobiia bacterium]|nr:ribbon-helix-helix protein, CopG family [Acidimicrobiia bacterium]
MTDILMRDVPDEVLAAIDAKAKRVGLSRTEYLRRALGNAPMSTPISPMIASARIVSTPGIEQSRSRTSAKGRSARRCRLGVGRWTRRGNRCGPGSPRRPARGSARTGP